VVRAAIWHLAIGLVALAALGERLSADESGQAGIPAVAPEGAFEPSAVEPASAVGPEDPPAVEPTPPQGPGTESVPPGEALPGEPGQNPDGLPLPAVPDILEDGQQCTPVVSSNCWFAPNHWYATSDFMVINHDKAKRNTRIAVDVTTGQFLTEQNLNLGITEGGRFTIGVWTCHDTYGWDHAVEASFVGLTDWHRHFEFIGEVPGAIFTIPNPNIGGFNGGDVALIYYKSQFNTGGIDLRWTKRPGKDALVYDPDGFWKRAAEDGRVFSFLLGIHDAELDERFTYNVRRANTGADVFAGDYTVRTTNNLLGLHIGSELDYKHDLWYVGIRGGSTIAVNFAEVDSDLDFRDPRTTPTSGSQHQNAFHTTPGAISDMSLLAGWQVRPNMRLRVSYDLMWLTSVARAPSQIRLGNFQPQAITVSSDQMFTGVSLGLEFNW
jgi:hypothetical protein